MAKKSKEKKFPTRLTTDWKENFDPEANEGFFQNEEEAESVAELDFRLEEMFNARENRGEEAGQFTSLTDEWDYYKKLGSMWHGPDDEDDPRPNVKGTFVTSAVRTTMAEMYDQNIGFVVKAWSSKAYKVAPATENIINYPWEKYNYSKEALSAMEESLECGSAWIKGDYRVIEREVKFKPTKASEIKDLTKEEKKKIDEGKSVWRKKTRVEFNDYTIEHVPLTEVYVDPAARCVHGKNYAANDIIRERRLSFEQFLQEYGTNPDFINLDKVHIGSDIEKTHPFFAFPRGSEDENFVIVREWERVLEDEWRITANGVLITPKDYPLKFNGYKGLSYHLLTPMKRAHELYGFGLGKLLEGIQVEDEVVRNGLLEVIEMANDPIIITNNVVHGEFTEQYERSGGGVISITGDPRQVQWMEAPVTMLAQYLGMRAQFETEAIKVSLIDPKSAALPTQSPTAFEASAMTQATMKAFMMTIKHFAEGLGPLGNMIWEMQKEQYPLQYKPEDIEKRKGNATESLGVKRKQAKSREMLLDGVKLEEDKTGRLVSKQRPGKKFKFTVKDKFFNMSIDDMDVVMDLEPMRPFSKITQARQAQENLAQFVPLYQNGLDKHPKIKLLMKDIVYTQGSNPELLGDDSEDDEDAIKRALEQQKVIQNSTKVGKSSPAYESVPGIPGEPYSHTGEHVQRLVVLQAMISTHQAKIDVFEEEQQQIQGTVAAVGGPAQQVQPPDDILDSQIRASNLMQEFTMLAEHAQVDQMSEFEAGAMALQAMTGQQGPAQGGGAAPVPQPSGQPSAGNVSQGGPTDNTNLVPMPAQQQGPVV